MRERLRNVNLRHIARNVVRWGTVPLIALAVSQANRIREELEPPPSTVPRPGEPPVPFFPQQNLLLDPLQIEEDLPDSLTVPEGKGISLQAIPQDAAGPRIPFLLGDINVHIIRLESDGTIDPSTENLTDDEKRQIEAKIRLGFDWWKQWAKGNLEFNYTFSDVSSPYEPIAHPRSDIGMILGDAQKRLGYTNPDVFANADAQIMDQKEKTKSDFGITVWVFDASNDADGKSAPEADGLKGSSYAFLGGPIMVLHWNESNLGPLEAISAHETGHSGEAGDQYKRKNAKCKDTFGYNAVENQNNEPENVDQCASRVDSIMKSLGAFFTNAIDPYALAQVGYSDSPGGFAFDALGHPQFNGLIEADSDSIHLSGTAQILAHQSASGERSVNINRITGVDVITSDGIVHPIPAKDGSFNSAYEELDAKFPRALGITGLRLRFTGRLGGKAIVIEKSIGRDPEEYSVYMPIAHN